MNRLPWIHRALVPVVVLCLASGCDDGASDLQAANYPSVTEPDSGSDGATPTGSPADAGQDASNAAPDAGGDASPSSDPHDAGSGADAGSVPLHPRDASANAPPVTVTGPITNGKQFTLPADYDLGEHAYVEEEFFFEGTATSYALQGNVTTDGKWNATEGDKAKYKSRLLVRRPTSATKFNGTVVFEWFNVTA